MAGVFLINYAVEQDLLGPSVRCLLAFVLGVALIGGAEVLSRWEGMPAPGPPATAAGGVAVLFGAAYGTGALYALVPPLVGFLLMAIASLAGLALALRFGPLVAVVGLVGSFVAPALIETHDPSLPGLFIYLLFVTAAGWAVVRFTAWIWLGWASTVAGAVWVVLAIGAGHAGEVWAPALFVPASAALSLCLLPSAALDHRTGRRLAWMPCAALGVAGLLLAAESQGWEARAGVLLLTPLAIWRAAAEPRLRFLPFLAAGLFLLLILDWSVHVTDWPDLVVPPDRWTPSAVTALLGTAAFMAGLFAASGLWFQGRAGHPVPWASPAASIPVLTLAICYARVAGFHTRPGWAAAGFVLAAGQTFLAHRAMAAGGRYAQAIAGTYATGAVASIALGTSMLLSDQWLTMTVSLLLPALAWIEAKANLPPLRTVAVAVALVVLVRLTLNWFILDYMFGATLGPVVNSLHPCLADDPGR